jgi:hypothetical protein
VCVCVCVCVCDLGDEGGIDVAEAGIAEPQADAGAAGCVEALCVVERALLGVAQQRGDSLVRHAAHLVHLGVVEPHVACQIRGAEVQRWRRVQGRGCVCVCVCVSGGGV